MASTQSFAHRTTNLSNNDRFQNAFGATSACRTNVRTSEFDHLDNNFPARSAKAAEPSAPAAVQVAAPTSTSVPMAPRPDVAAASLPARAAPAPAAQPQTSVTTPAHVVHNRHRAPTRQQLASPARPSWWQRVGGAVARAPGRAPWLTGALLGATVGAAALLPLGLSVLAHGLFTGGGALVCGALLRTLAKPRPASPTAAQQASRSVASNNQAGQQVAAAKAATEQSARATTRAVSDGHAHAARRGSQNTVAAMDAASATADALCHPATTGILGGLLTGAAVLAGGLAAPVAAGAGLLAAFGYGLGLDAVYARRRPWPNGEPPRGLAERAVAGVGRAMAAAWHNPLLMGVAAGLSTLAAGLTMPAYAGATLGAKLAAAGANAAASCVLSFLSTAKVENVSRAGGCALVAGALAALGVGLQGASLSTGLLSGAVAAVAVGAAAYTFLRMGTKARWIVAGVAFVALAAAALGTGLDLRPLLVRFRPQKRKLAEVIRG